MKSSFRSRLIILALFSTLITLSSALSAQNVWIDENGNKQFSDQPPPPSVPKNKIIKFSGKTIDPQTVENDIETPLTGKHPDSLAEKELAYKKRSEEAAIKAKREAEEVKAAASKSDNCKRMGQYKQSLDSGERISQVDNQGQRTYLDDAQRSQEQNRLKESMAQCAN